jgi:predicted nucleic acid-binding protein
MKIFIDTNVVLDVLAQREPFYEASRGVWELVERGEAKGYLSAASITDVFYILRKHLGPQGAFDTVNKLLLVFSVASVSEKDIRMALMRGGRDFEDALQVVCAKRIQADYLITRNKEDFNDAEGIKIVAPEEFLQVVKK